MLTLRGHSNGVMSVAFRPDGRRLLTSSIDHTAKIWDTMSVAETEDSPAPTEGYSLRRFRGLAGRWRSAQANVESCRMVW